MEQIQRIKEAEDALDRAQAAIDALAQSWEKYLTAQEDIRLLERYLDSEERRRDLDADSAGLLPKQLRRGVLSEDGIWNTLEKNAELLQEMKHFLSA